MKLLALDCSTQACSVALLTHDANGSVTIKESFELAARQHTERLLPMVDQLLVDTGTDLSQLEAIAFGCGPGSFTGLRICIGAVQGLAYAAEIPVVPVSTLAAQAKMVVNSTPEHAFEEGGLIISTLDARMDEIYWGVYQYRGGTVELLGSERLTPPEQLLEGQSQDLTGMVAVGSGYNYSERVGVLERITRWEQTILPTATAVAQLGLTDYQAGIYCRADQATPVYLRDEVTWQKQPPAGLGQTG